MFDPDTLNNIIYEMILRRKSFHIFRNVGNESISKDELNDIQSAYSEFTPLDPGIKTAIRIVPEKETNCKRGGEYCNTAKRKTAICKTSVISVNSSTFIWYPEISERSGSE